MKEIDCNTQMNATKKSIVYLGFRGPFRNNNRGMADCKRAMKETSQAPY